MNETEQEESQEDYERMKEEIKQQMADQIEIPFTDSLGNLVTGTTTGTAGGYSGLGGLKQNIPGPYYTQTPTVTLGYPTTGVLTRTRTDRDGTWVELDPDEPNMPAGITLWKNGTAKKLTIKELLRLAGMEW